MGKSWDDLSNSEKDEVSRELGGRSMLYSSLAHVRRIYEASVRRQDQKQIDRYGQQLAELEEYVSEREPLFRRAWTVSQELPKIRKAQYRLYLQSDEWRERADRVLARDSFACRICGATDNLHVHHLTYDRKYNESDYDLITVCKQCHRTIHKLK